MRIALLSTSYPRERGDAGGLFVQAEAVALSGEGHEVFVLVPGRPVTRAERARAVTRSERDAVGTGPLVHRLGAADLFGWPGALHRTRASPARLVQALGFMARARALLGRIRPERTIAHFIVPCGYPLCLGTTGELEVVLHGSDARLLGAAPRFVRTEVARALLARGAHLRFASDRLRREFVDAFAPAMQRMLLQRSRVALPPLSVPAPQKRAARGAGEVESWVACGRLVRSKRVDRALHEAAKRGARLTVVGDGPERHDLEALARRILPGTRFTGHLPHHEALALIAGCDRLVHMSALEGAPSVVREARALGVPVLATAAGDIAAWAALDPGVELFEPGDLS